MKRVSLLLVVVLVLSCSKKLSIGRIAEDYDTFYNQFHADKTFQLDRVKFPLNGSYEDATGTLVWNQSNWIFQQEKMSEITLPNYDVQVTKTEDQVVETIKLRGSGYESERRFQLIDGKWYLVYYDTTNL
jgi:hypothetical protein